MKNIVKGWITNETKVTLWCVIFSAISLILSLIQIPDFHGFDIAWAAIILCGVPIVTEACIGLVKRHDVTADLLVSMALIASVITREWFAAGEVAFIMQIGSLLEDYTANRAKKGIESLIKLTPQKARVIRNGKEILIPVEDVNIGDELSILAGETIPVDGVITEGNVSIDQSAMTGESIPVDKKPGDEVISGTINQFGTFTMKATKKNTDSSLQRMIRLAEETDANKAPIVSLADKWAAYLVGIALTCAIIAFIVTGQFMRAVTVLVVFCPCAFVLATPTAVAAAIGNLTKYGILIRTGDALERLSKVDTIAFDKTGTLTYGKPTVVHVKSLDPSFTEENILKMAAISESESEHPLGRAIVDKWNTQGHRTPAADRTEILAGLGIKAFYEGQVLIAGKPELLKQQGIDISFGKTTADNWYKEGATVIFLSIDGKAIGMIGLADTLRKEARSTITRLKKQGITPVLLTGDNSSAAFSIAKQAGISNVFADLMPEDKLKAVKNETDKGKKVCMIGDGINDSLALSSAWAGIAMGGVGSDIAVESSDAVLVNDNIERIPYLMYMTRKTMKKIRQNIILSMCINFGAIILSFLGILTPVTGAVWHNIGSVAVVVNAALLLSNKDKKAPDRSLPYPLR